MKNVKHLLVVAALLASVTIARANDLPYEDDGGDPDDPVPSEDAVDLGGSGAPQGFEALDLEGTGLRNQLSSWIAMVSGYIVTLPNRSQLIG